MALSNYFRLDDVTDSAKKTQPPGSNKTKNKTTHLLSRQAQHYHTGSGPSIRTTSGALFGYNASPEDPHEISFSKFEILEAADITGKWWPARKEGG